MKLKKNKKGSICIETQTELCMQDFKVIDRSLVKLSDNFAMEREKVTTVWQQQESGCIYMRKQNDTSCEASNGVERERIEQIATQIMKLQKEIKVFFEVNFEKTNTHSRKIKDLYDEINKKISAHDELKSDMKELKSDMNEMKDELKTEKRKNIKLEAKLETFELTNEQQNKELYQKVNEIYADQVSNGTMQAKLELTRKKQLELEAKLKRNDDTWNTRMKRFEALVGNTNSKTGWLGEKLDTTELKVDRLEAETLGVRGQLEKANLNSKRLLEHIEKTDSKVRQIEQITEDNKRLSTATKGKERTGMLDTLRNEENAVGIKDHLQNGVQEACGGLCEIERRFEKIGELEIKQNTSGDETYVKTVAVQDDPSLEEYIRQQFEDLYNFP